MRIRLKIKSKRCECEINFRQEIRKFSRKYFKSCSLEKTLRLKRLLLGIREFEKLETITNLKRRRSSVTNY